MEEGSDQIDEELLFARAFFMGLTAGVLLEKFSADSPAILCKKAEPWVTKVTDIMQSATNYAKISELLG